MLDIIPAWIGTLATWTFISTIVGIVAGVTTIFFTCYRMYLLRKQEKRNAREV